MVSHWRLFESAHNGALTVSSPGDTPVDITSYLADDAQKIVLDANEGTGIVTDIVGPPPLSSDPDENTIIYEMIYPSRQIGTKYIFIGGFDPDIDFIVRVSSTDDHDLGYTQIAIYEYGLQGLFEATPLQTGVDPDKNTAFLVSLETSDQRMTSKFRMSAPFFGVDTILDGYCYEGGREHTFAGKLNFQNTRTSRYVEALPNFESKVFTIPSVELSFESFYYKKLQKLNGRLVLLEEDYGGDNKEYILGYLEAKPTTRRSSGRSRFSFTIHAKHINYAISTGQMEGPGFTPG